MALQIANQRVVGKIERLAEQTGLTKTAAVERAVDHLLGSAASPGEHLAAKRRMAALLAQLDRIPDLPAPADPLEWDEHGLPR